MAYIKQGTAEHETPVEQWNTGGTTEKRWNNRNTTEQRGCDL